MHELFEKMRRHRVNIDGNVSTVMFTTLVLEVSCSIEAHRKHSSLDFIEL